MAASDQLPLTVTYTPTSGVTTTVTVLGQVLNNGATNWVPTGGHAIYLATSSESGASQTVLDGSTYYLTTGPAVPDQATGVTITLSSSASSGSGMAPMTSSGQASSGAATPASSSAPITKQSQSMSASQSAPASASMSMSASGTHTGAGSRSVSSLSKLGYAMACICLAGIVMA